MKIKSLVLFCLIMASAIISCKKSGNPTPKPLLPGVYAVGYTGKNSLTATYWKNGVAIQLTSANRPSIAYSIAINGTDVYIVGNISPVYGNHAIACYWKNGVITKLTDSSSYSQATAIVISNNDVYIAGYVGADPVYWKNGVITKLSDAHFESCVATSIAVDGTDVYVGGHASTAANLFYQAAYWKNGVITLLPLPSGLTFSDTNGIAVSGNNVIVAGDVFDLTSGAEAGYWLKGSFNTFTNLSATNNVVYSVTTNGSDIFMAGDSQITNGVVMAQYWKNGVLVDFTHGMVGSDAHSIAIAGNDIYVGGFTSGQYTPPIEVPNGKAAYWKNGNIVQLSNVNSGVMGIAVVEH